MTIFDTIRKKKAEFQQRQNVVREAKYEKLEKESKRLSAIASREKEISAAKRSIAESRQAVRDARFSGIKSFGARVKSNLERNQSVARQQNNTSMWSNSNAGSIYTGGGTSRGLNSNPFTMSSNSNNPYNFSSSKPSVKRKSKGRQIIIRM